MNKLLITGLAVGRDAGVCSTCNYDLSWLIDYPSVLLWADRIMITDSIWQFIQEEHFPDNDKVEFTKACRLIFDIARDRGIVEIAKPSPLFNPNLHDAILEQIYSDLEKIRLRFPDKIKQRTMSPKRESPTETLIDGIGFCIPFLGSIYASLILAKEWKANCLFGPHVLQYLRYKFGIEAFPKQADAGRIQSFTNIFNSYFPNKSIFPGYIFDSNGRCLKCKNEKTCRETYLKEIETNTMELLKWRDYDEIQQTKVVIDEIVSKFDKEAIPDPQEAVKEFRDKQFKLTKRIRSIFPKINRWANVTTLVSIPLAIAGLTTNASLVTYTGVITAGLAKFGKECVKFLESKYRWVGFLQEMAVPLKKKSER